MTGTVKDIFERDPSKQFLIGGSGVSDLPLGLPIASNAVKKILLKGSVPYLFIPVTKNGKPHGEGCYFVFW